MDYKYIEQLMERYWRAETTVEEEDILRAFFSQKDIPASLLAYQPLFTCIRQEKEAIVTDDDFDRRILARTEDARTVKARTISLTQRAAPLIKAAAAVAVVITLGASADFILDMKQARQEVSANVDEEPLSPYDMTVAQTDTLAVDTTKSVSQTTTNTSLDIE